MLHVFVGSGLIMSGRELTEMYLTKPDLSINRKLHFDRLASKVPTTLILQTAMQGLIVIEFPSNEMDQKTREHRKETILIPVSRTITRKSFKTCCVSLFKSHDEPLSLFKSRSSIFSIQFMI
jgi:hypothetical protein